MEKRAILVDGEETVILPGEVLKLHPHMPDIQGREIQYVERFSGSSPACAER